MDDDVVDTRFRHMLRDVVPDGLVGLGERDVQGTVRDRISYRDDDHDQAEQNEEKASSQCAVVICQMRAVTLFVYLLVIGPVPDQFGEGGRYEFVLFYIIGEFHVILESVDPPPERG